MQFGLAIVVVFVGIVFWANGTDIRNYNSRNYDTQMRSRIIRQYPPERSYSYPSLGVGFGKRNGYTENSNINNQDKSILSFLRDVPQGLSSEWILRELRTNPILACKLSEMIMNIENNQTPIEEIQSEGMTSVF